MSYKKILSLIPVLLLFCLFSLCNSVTAQDSGLPPLIINAQDFPLEQNQSVTMQKTLWGDKEETTFELSTVQGTTNIGGTTAQIVKTYDTNGKIEEDYFTKNGDRLMNMGTTRENMDKLVPSLNFQFPLKLNSEWTVFEKTISGKDVLITAKVVSHEILGVPAGNFQCLKVEITSGFSGEERVKNSEIWIAPGVGIIKEKQQVEENLTQIRELISFHSGSMSFLSSMGAVPPGKNWNGTGKSIYEAIAKHPSNNDILKQNIEISYNFTFTINPQSGFLTGQGQATIDKFENSWSNQSIEGTNMATFNFIGKKEGDTLKFYDGIIMSAPENFKLSEGGQSPLLKILDHSFRLSATISGNSVSASREIGRKDKTHIILKWQASQ